ncbi:MAG: putative N-acetylmannosamine-6-phosphate 2-epimerase [Erysipelotrichia bacterium]|nr:putative N-acetylmannosamine-6-phosphate 2-epimerase [Erysipelotrichia bacterium]
MNKKEEILDKIRGRVIVSCQGDPLTNPIGTPENLTLMAKCAVLGGCAGFRANMPYNIEAIKREYPEIPMIGIWKIMTEGCDVYITPTMQAVDKLVELGCEIIAMDGTDRLNADGNKAYTLIAEAKKKYPDVLIMADIADLNDAKLSAEAGADICSTTLSGYTSYTKDKTGICDFELVRQIKEADLGIFIITEGKIWTREDALKAYECGTDSIVIGTAITNPISITKRFVQAVSNK